MSFQPPYYGCVLPYLLGVSLVWKTILRRIKDFDSLFSIIVIKEQLVKLFVLLTLQIYLVNTFVNLLCLSIISTSGDTNNVRNLLSLYHKGVLQNNFVVRLL